MPTLVVDEKRWVLPRAGPGEGAARLLALSAWPVLRGPDWQAPGGSGLRPRLRIMGPSPGSGSDRVNLASFLALVVSNMGFFFLSLAWGGFPVSKWSR